MGLASRIIFITFVSWTIALSAETEPLFEPFMQVFARGNLIINQQFDVSSLNETCDSVMEGWKKQVMARTPSSDSMGQFYSACNGVSKEGVVKSFEVLFWLAPINAKGVELLEQFRKEMDGYEMWRVPLRVEEIKGVSVEYTYVAGPWKPGTPFRRIVETRRKADYADMESTIRFVAQMMEMFNRNDIKAFLQHLTEQFGEPLRRLWEDNYLRHGNMVYIDQQITIYTDDRAIEQSGHIDPVMICSEDPAKACL